MYIPLYTKYRPQSFEEITEQKEVTEILLNQISSGKIRNSYLFVGASGVGKTTLARILSKVINKGSAGIIEMDAASNNSVDDVRAILSESNYMALDAEYKIYIMDEVHMFSNGAWNSMLKTLEEPPAKTIFMLCTTDPQKIPDTILNRVQRFDLTRISYKGIVDRLRYIVDNEMKDRSITVSDDSIEYIAKLANGGMRDAITMLDKCMSYKDNIVLEDVVKILGSVDYTLLFNLFFEMYNCNEKQVIEIVEGIYNSGSDLKLFVTQYSNFLSDLCKYKLFGNCDYINIPNIFKESLDRAKNSDSEVLKKMLSRMTELKREVKYESLVLPIVETELLLLSRE